MYINMCIFNVYQSMISIVGSSIFESRLYTLQVPLQFEWRVGGQDSPNSMKE